MDFDLDLGAETPSLPEPAVEAPPAAPAAAEASPLDFDFNLGDAPAPAPVEEAPAPAVELELPPLDLSDISLDLDAPAAEAAAPAAAAVEVDDPEVATKLELAQAYEEMGDKEGARELLNEVILEGSPSQQAAARAKLDLLG